MASYFSAAFLVLFLPIALIAYGIVPARARWACLLLVSYAFAFVISRGLMVFILGSTLVVYACGRGMRAIYDKRALALESATKGKREIRRAYKTRARVVMVAGIVANFGILVYLKYLGFFASVFAGFGIGVGFVPPRIGAPVGISFYTLMAVSYLVDVYRETCKADAHLGHVALYLCYFPYLMEGPIARYGDVAPDLWEGRPFVLDNVYAGSLRVIVGFIKKVVVADRLNTLVGTVFDQYGSYDGGVIAVAAVLYTLQLYCDFAGTMDVACGLSQMFGITLPENFRQPFFSRTSSEFWQRWHITLGAWFKDYVYYPVTMSKVCKTLTKKARKRFGRLVGPMLTSMIALFCVWMGNGLWHGAGSQYIAFGLYYFLVISAGGFVEIGAQRMATRFGINRESVPYVVFRVVRTLLVVFVGELIFRANSSADGLAMLGRIATDFSLGQLGDGTLLRLGIDGHDLAVVAAGLVGVLAVDALVEKGTRPLDVVASKRPVVRWGIWMALLMVVVVFAAYGFNYTPVDPMYADY